MTPDDPNKDDPDDCQHAPTSHRRRLRSCDARHVAIAEASGPYGDGDTEAINGLFADPADLVVQAVEDLFGTFDAWRLYADPPQGDQAIAGWMARYGRDRVGEWHMWRDRAISYACRDLAEAITVGLFRHAGDALVTLPIWNAHKRPVNAKDEYGERLRTIRKRSAPSSPLRIDPAASAKRPRYEDPGAGLDSPRAGDRRRWSADLMVPPKRCRA